VAVLVVLAGLTAGCARGAGPTVWQSDFTPESIKRFDDFPLYWTGTRFRDWPLLTIDGPEPGGFITFLYGTGTCTPRGGDEGGCDMPGMQIQVQAICDHLAIVTGDPIWRRRRIRSARVGRIDNAPVLFARHAQIKVYADSPALALQVLRELRSVTPGVDREDPMPALPDAVLRGDRPCPA